MLCKAFNIFLFNNKKLLPLSTNLSNNPNIELKTRVIVYISIFKVSIDMSSFIFALDQFHTVLEYHAKEKRNLVTCQHQWYLLPFEQVSGPVFAVAIEMLLHDIEIWIFSSKSLYRKDDDRTK